MIAGITKDRIAPSLKGATKKEILRELAALMSLVCQDVSEDEIATILLEREKIGSTGIGDGIAIPHGKMKDLKKIEIFFARSVQGVPFDAADNKPVHLFFLLLAPTDSSSSYLNTLATLARFLKRSQSRSRLIQAETTEEILSIFKKGDGTT